MTNSKQLIFVAGATGAQGGATARELLAHGFAVRFLTRRIDSTAARELVQLGAEAMAGDFDDRASLMAATRDANGVFSMQVPDSTDTDSERRHGLELIDAALKNNVQQFVHTSVTGTGEHENFPRWQEGYWSRKYWTDKWDIEQAVRAAGFKSWTVLKPAFMMDNFAQPKSRFMFPQLSAGEIATALRANTRLQLIAADDVGRFARHAFERPAIYSSRNIDLAAEALTMNQVAQVLSRVTGHKVAAVELTPQQALARGLSAGWVRSQEWSNEIGYRADIDALSQYGVELISFEQWASKRREQIVINR
jgi:uncharacterized protein YbjT (DUF2867 family)